MNKLTMILVAVVLAVPGVASADALTDSIRSNGQAALSAIQDDIKASVVLAPAQVTYPVPQAIRMQGREALRRIALEIEMGVVLGGMSMAGHTQPVRVGTVTVSALETIGPAVSESL